MKLQISLNWNNNIHRNYQCILLLIISFCIGQSPIIAQKSPEKDHFYQYYQALILYQTGDTTESLTTLLHLFGNTEFGDLGHIYNSLRKAMESNSTDLMQVLIKSGVRKGADIKDLKSFVTSEEMGGRKEYGRLIRENQFTADLKYYKSHLDSFLITELLHLEKRDQLFRDEYLYNIPDGYDKYLDSLNFLVLKKIVEMEGGKLPAYRKIGPEGSSALSTILIHLDIEMISALFPAIIKSISLGEFFDAESILYQIDRNIVGGYPLYRYDKKTDHLIKFGEGRLLHNKLGNYQYYGSMDLSDMKTRTVNFWPFCPSVDDTIQQEMYDILKVLPPLTNPMKSHIKLRTSQEFINLFLNQN